MSYKINPLVPIVVFVLKYRKVIDNLIFTKRTIASGKALQDGKRKGLNKDLFYKDMTNSFPGLTSLNTSHLSEKMQVVAADSKKFGSFFELQHTPSCN